MRPIYILVLLLALVAPLATSAAVRPAALVVSAPTQVAAGAQFELTLTLQDATNFGGYEALLRFDTGAAHFNGLTHGLANLQQIGRGTAALGEVEQAHGIAFGGYSCPLAQCAGLATTTRQAAGANGSIRLATIALVADKPGTLELNLGAAQFVDATGAPLVVAAAEQSIRVQVGPAATPLHAAPPLPALSGQAGNAAPLDLSGDRRVSNADLMEAVLAWTLAREADAPCAAAPAADTNGDGCVTVADIQRIAAAHNGSPPRQTSAGPDAAASFTVNSAGDQADQTPGDGICATAAATCTLRAAIAEANLASGPDTITFNIGGAGVKTIALATPLPTLSDESGATTINGYSQPGAAANNDPNISNATILIELTPAASVATATIEAINISSAGNTIRGLAFYKFRRAIVAFGNAADGNLFAGNFIGTNASGQYAASAIADSGNGIELKLGAGNNTIGGTNPADRNVISGNPKHGVATFNGETDGNKIIGNLIGLAPRGDRRLANFSFGVDLNSFSSNNIVGGTNPGERNIISGNGGEGVEVSHGEKTRNNRIIGNYIGTDVSGKAATSYSYNGWHGVHIEDGPSGTIIAQNVIGNNRDGGIAIEGFETGYYPTGTQVYSNRIGLSLDGTALPNGKYGIKIKDHSYTSKIGPGNIIANNPAGIQIEGPDTDFHTITGNSIYANGGLGIDLEPLGSPNPNDSGDGDSGTNQGLNMPEFESATPTQVQGRACAGCRVEVFLADGGEGAYGQGKTLLGSTTTNAGGNFTLALSGLKVGDYLTATATDTSGDTSEFARNQRVVAAPQSIPPQKTYLASVHR